MGALAQGLALATAPAAAPVPAPPAGRAAAAPAVPAVRPGGNGALQQAIGIMGDARAATSADPTTAMAAEAVAQDKAARDQAASELAARMEEIKALQAQPDVPRPAVPRLEKLPEAPVPEKRDPMRVFGQFLPVIAALGALTTKTPALAALNAATAMLTAAKNNDREEEAKQRQTWIDSLNTTVQTNTSLMNDYKLALEDRNLTVTDRLAKINSIAALNKDTITLATLRGGNLDSLSKFIGLQQKATEQLAGLATQLSEQDLQRQRLAQQEMMQFAQLELDRRRVAQVSMGDAIGPVLVKIQQASPEKAAQGLDKVLTPGEMQALKLYMDINSGQRYGAPAGGAPGGGLGALAPGAPAAAPAAAAAPAPAPAAPPAAPVVTSAPPVSMLTEGMVTPFKNGQAWTLRGGKAVRVK